MSFTDVELLFSSISHKGIVGLLLVLLSRYKNIFSPLNFQFIYSCFKKKNK